MQEGAVAGTGVSESIDNRINDPSGARNRTNSDSPQELMQAIHNQIENLCTISLGSEFEDVDTTASVSIEILRLSLLLPNDQRFSWNVWVAGVTPIVDEARRAEELTFSAKLTEFGLHKHSHEITKRLEEKRGSDERNLANIAQRVHEQANRAQVAHGRHLRDVIRSVDVLRKSCQTGWTKILGELAHERGPWGAGVEAINDVSLKKYMYSIIC
jgi:hypothetical protein